MIQIKKELEKLEEAKMISEREMKNLIKPIRQRNHSHILIKNRVYKMSLDPKDDIQQMKAKRNKVVKMNLGYW